MPAETKLIPLKVNWFFTSVLYEFSTGDPERWGDYTAIARDPVVPTTVAVYGAYPLDVGAGATTDVWQHVIATLDDV